MNVLFVDDDPLIREMGSAALTESGHAVTAAASGIQACRMLKESAFDVLVTDVFMPDMDGLELVRKARSLYPGLWIVTISGGSPLVPLDCLNFARMFGAQVVLAKPFSIASLVEAVAGAALAA